MRTILIIWKWSDKLGHTKGEQIYGTIPVQNNSGKIVWIKVTKLVHLDKSPEWRDTLTQGMDLLVMAHHLEEKQIPDLLKQFLIKEFEGHYTSFGGGIEFIYYKENRKSGFLSDLSRIDKRALINDEVQKTKFDDVWDYYTLNMFKPFLFDTLENINISHALDNKLKISSFKEEIERKQLTFPRFADFFWGFFEDKIEDKNEDEDKTYLHPIFNQSPDNPTHTPIQVARQNLINLIRSGDEIDLISFRDAIRNILNLIPGPIYR
jgi:hypothetical protein